MTHAEIETIVNEFAAYQAILKNHEDQNRHDFAFLLESVVDRCNSLGFNPWPAVKAFFKTYSIAIHPEYPQFEKQIQLVAMLLKEAKQGQITDSMVNRMFSQVYRFRAVASAIEADIPYPKDPRHLEWKAKQDAKPKPEPEERDPIDPPNVPLATRTDLENALKEMCYFWRDNGPKLGDLGDFAHHISSIGLAVSMLGYLPPPGVEKRMKGITLDHLPDVYPDFLELMNKVYRLYQAVATAGQPTEGQLARAYRLNRRVHRFAHEVIPRLRELAEAVEEEPLGA